MNTVSLRARAWLLAVLIVFGLVGCREEPPAPQPSIPQPSAPQPAVAASSAAPSPSATASVAADQKATDARPFLYEVKKGSASGHLLGTMHLGGDPDEDLHPVVWARFDEAPMVVIEADLGAINPLEMVQRMQLPPGQTLSSKLSKKQFETLTSKLSGMPPLLDVDRLKPHAAMSFLVQQMVPKTQPMDLVIQSRAKRANKKVGYLESVDQQLRLIEKAIDLEALAFSLDHVDEMEERLKEMTQAYVSGDAPKLVAAVFDPEEMKAQPEMFDELFTQRNATWVKDKLPGFFEQGAFVACGAGHLLGDDSVVAMLRKAGWTVERVKP